MTTLRCIARRAAATTTTPTLRATATPTLRPARRALHTVPTLDNHDQLVANGLPGLFSRDGFRTAWTKYQAHMVEQLNEISSGTKLEGQDAKSLIIDMARDPTQAYTFNCASMAFNNHFFFRGLNTHPGLVSVPPPDLAIQIKRDFSSLDTLRDTFLSTADAMFGPGFVWLVQINEQHAPGALRILPTYIAGSPLSGAHYRRQSHDLTTHNAASYATLKNKVGAFGPAADQDTRPKKPLGGVDIVPLLCVNTWEHAWLHDYGVEGKSAYLQAWWTKIDWDTVRQNATLSSQNSDVKKFHYLNQN